MMRSLAIAVAVAVLGPTIGVTAFVATNIYQSETISFTEARPGLDG